MDITRAQVTEDMYEFYFVMFETFNYSLAALGTTIYWFYIITHKLIKFIF